MKKKKSEKAIDFILGHRKLFTLLSMVLPIFFIVISTIFKNQISKSLSRIETAYYVSQIVATIFVITGTVVAAWQYYLSSKADIRQTKLIQVQKAIDLSEYYKNNILQKYAAIEYVYNRCGIKAILDKIKADDMKDFDEKELNRLLPKSDVDRLKEIANSEEYARAIVDANIIYNLNLNIKTRLQQGENEGENLVQVAVHPLLVSFIFSMKQELLNNMEFFAMHFRHKTADSTVVYRSLHQTYLDIVQNMYYSIAEINKLPESKYYTNVIALYREWYDKNQEECKKINIHEKELSHGTVID